MPTPAHVRVTFSGVFGGATAPIEIWAHSLNFRRPPTVTAASLDAAVATMRTAWANNLALIFPPAVVLTRTRIADVDDLGRVVRNPDGSYVQSDNTATAPGTYTTTAPPVMPLQTALVVTLLTTRPGSTGKGRFFLPWPYYSLSSTDYRLSTANQSTLAQTAKTFVQACRTSLGSAPVVASSKGYLTDVTGVRVGRAPDTMRSRRGALLEEAFRVDI